MSYDLALKNFRGFRLAPFVPIRPITLLIGENSAGKSSFLAALKYVLDFASAEEEPSFNKDPFQLGTFQQISHYRGGRAGRAREFSLTVRTMTRPRRRQEREARPVTFQVTFSSSESVAIVSRIQITVGDESAIAVVESDRISVTYVDPNADSYAIENSVGYPRVARSDFSRDWPLILRDISYRVTSRDREGGQESLLDVRPEQRVSAILEYAEGMTSGLRARTLATSPIRTKPRRTYTPGVEERNSEERTSPTRWQPCIGHQVRNRGAGSRRP